MQTIFDGDRVSYTLNFGWNRGPFYGTVVARTSDRVFIKWDTGKMDDSCSSFFEWSDKNKVWEDHHD